MHRRVFLGRAAAGAVVAIAGSTGAEEPVRSRMGICVYALGNRVRAKLPEDPPLEDPLHFFEYCRGLGAGGVQVPIRVRDKERAPLLRRRAEELGMFVEGVLRLPAGNADLDRFDAEVRVTRLAGATVARTVLVPARRWEGRETLEAFREAEARGIESLQLAEPIASRHGLKLAVENHKDQRVEERLKVFEGLRSEAIGACVDVANSFALLEDPVEVVKAYAPWAITVHLKDLVVEETRDGFRMIDVALGDGILDLPAMVEVLRRATRGARFNLESITRDPVDVPCLSGAYQASLGDVPARDLARTLLRVKAGAGKGFPGAADLPLGEQVRREEETVRRSLAYARERLSL